jgi:hypothetical protein
MNALWNDVRYAVRSFLASPRFSVSVVVTLAIGIASSTMVSALPRAFSCGLCPIPSRIGSHMLRRLTPVSRKAADNFMPLRPYAVIQLPQQFALLPESAAL